MKIDEFRKDIEKHDKDHPELPNCIYYNCVHKIKPAWDNQVLCEEHSLLFLFWFYEEGGYAFCPDTWDMDTGKKLPKRDGSDDDMTAYRKRYCDWIASLTNENYESILKHQIGDESK